MRNSCLLVHLAVFLCTCVCGCIAQLLIAAMSLGAPSQVLIHIHIYSSFFCSFVQKVGDIVKLAETVGLKYSEIATGEEFNCILIKVRFNTKSVSDLELVIVICSYLKC